MSAEEARAEAERAAFEVHEAPTWAAGPLARLAAIRWYMRGFNAAAEWQASREVTEAVRCGHERD